MEKIRIGTRGSKLALWQAYWVRDMLAEKGVESEIITIETKGDKILNTTIAKIGSKGVFTEEIEAQLESGAIDIAVHSAKDMQSVLPEGFEIVAFTKREKPTDVLVSSAPIDLTQPLLIGTSSTRRIAFLKNLYPKMSTVPVRGNLQTRIKKMNEGACDALLLAYAGVHRMGYDGLIVHEFPLDQWVPPVGQGSVAIEVYHTLSEDKKQLIQEVCQDAEATDCLLAERAFLKTLEGGCSIPVFGHATLQEDQTVELTGGIVSLDGANRVEATLQGSRKEANAIGATLAEQILDRGGRVILKEIRTTLNN